MERTRGIVAWFNSGKGYGFLSPVDDGGLMTGGKDVFCHFSDIDMDGYKTLTQGDHVEFDPAERDGRTVATNVRVVEKAVGHVES